MGIKHTLLTDQLKVKEERVVYVMAMCSNNVDNVQLQEILGE